MDRSTDNCANDSRACAAPTVSVIIPTYNSAGYMSEALDSVFAQTFTDFEVIVINDGSPDTDKLEKVLEPYVERIIYLKQENRGVGSARNTGIGWARGKYIAFLDGDDCWRPEYLRAQIKPFEEAPSLDLVYSDADLFGDFPLPRRTFMTTSNPPVTLEGLLLDGGQIIPSGAVVRRQTIIDAGLFNESLGRCEDYDMWLRMAYRGAKIAHQSSVLVLRRVHGRALTADNEKMSVDLIRVLNEVKGTFVLSPQASSSLQKQLNELQAEVAIEHGKACLLAGDFSSAKDLLTKANDFVDSWKLRLALIGLRFAPSMTQFMANAWHRVLLGASNLRLLRRSS